MDPRVTWTSSSMAGHLAGPFIVPVRQHMLINLRKQRALCDTEGWLEMSIISQLTNWCQQPKS